MSFRSAPLSEHPPNIWKRVQGHQWSNELYRIALEYMKGMESANALVRSWSSDKRYTFRQRVQWYAIHETDPTQIVFRTRISPPCIVSSTSSLLQADGTYTWKVVSEQNVNGIIHRFRADPLIVSFSRDGLYARIFESGYLGISRSMIDKFLKRFPVRRPETPQTRGSIKSYRPMYPLEHFQIDLIVMNQPGIREANQPYLYILVVIDIFSKFTWLRPLKTKEASEIAGHMQLIFLQGDIPKKVQTDQGTEFMGVFDEVLARFHVTHIVNDPYSPQTNGVVENRNKTIKQHIWQNMESFVDQVSGRKSKRYVDILDRIAFNLNNTKHTVTKLTPSQVHRGTHFQIPSISRQVPIIEYGPLPCMDDIATEDPELQRRQMEYARNEARLYQTRVAEVRSRIHETADRREIARATSNEIQVGSMVQIGTVSKIGTNQMQFNPVRIGAETRLRVPGARNPVDMIPFAFSSKWIDKTYPDIFVVKQIVQNEARTKQYIVRKKNDREQQIVERMKDTNENWTELFPKWLLKLAPQRERKARLPDRPRYVDPIDISLPEPILLPRSTDFSRLRERDVRAILQTENEVIGRRIRQWWKLLDEDRIEPYEGTIVSRGTRRRGLPGWVIRYDGMERRANREYDIPLFPSKYGKQVHEGWVFVT